MQKSIKIILTFFAVLMLVFPLYSQKKLAQTGFQFLSVVSDARGGSMADAMTAMELGSRGLFFNPAGMSRMWEMGKVFDVVVSKNYWIGGIEHNSLSMSFCPFGGRYGVVGVSVLSVDYGEVEGTMVWGNDKGYIDTEVMRPSAFAIGVGYARSLTDKFSVGGQVKYTGQQLGKSIVPVTGGWEVKKNLAYAVAFDFGTLYRTGWKSLVFGMSVRNFSNEIKYEEEGFQLPLTFRIGVSMDLLDLVNEEHGSSGLLMSVDAVHPRSYPEQLNIGLEYSMFGMMYLRCGYYTNSDEKSVVYGIGIRKYGLGIDYAYTPYGVFDNVQRFSVSFSF